jgi:hypothetical protein
MLYLDHLLKLLDFSQRFAETESQRRIDFTPTTATLPTVGAARATPTVTINQQLQRTSRPTSYS